MLRISGCVRVVNGVVNVSVFVCGESAVYQHILKRHRQKIQTFEPPVVRGIFQRLAT